MSCLGLSSQCIRSFLPYFLLLLYCVSCVCFFLFFHPCYSHVRGILCGIHTSCMISPFPTVYAKWSLEFWSVNYSYCPKPALSPTCNYNSSGNIHVCLTTSAVFTSNFTRPERAVFVRLARYLLLVSWIHMCLGVSCYSVNINFDFNVFMSILVVFVLNLLVLDCVLLTMFVSFIVMYLQLVKTWGPSCLRSIFPYFLLHLLQLLWCMIFFPRVSPSARRILCGIQTSCIESSFSTVYTEWSPISGR